MLIFHLEAPGRKNKEVGHQKGFLGGPQLWLGQTWLAQSMLCGKNRLEREDTGPMRIRDGICQSGCPLAFWYIEKGWTHHVVLLLESAFTREWQSQWVLPGIVGCHLRSGSLGSVVLRVEGQLPLRR